MRRLLKQFGLLILTLVLLLAPIHTAYAAISDPLSFPFYDPNSTGCDSGSISLSGNDNAEKIYNFLLSKGLTNIQAIGIMANLQAESGFDPAKEEYGSGTGYGLAQWTGGRRDKLEKAAADQGVSVSDLGFQLEFLWGELAGSYKNSVLVPLQATTSLNDAVDIVLEKFEAPKVLNYEKRRSLAIALYESLGGATAPDGAVVSISNGCSIAANGDVVQTAVALAWPDGGHGKEEADATPAYQQAMPKYNGATTDDPFSDCGVFVATIMIMTGADPTYPKRDTYEQLKYLTSSPKYSLVNTTSTADLRPGDIFITDGHTYLYVGPQAGGYSAVGASLHNHVPEATGGAYFSDTAGGNTRTYKVFRLK